MVKPDRNHLIIVIEENCISPSLDAEIRDLLCLIFPEDAEVYSRTRYWHGSAPSYSLVYRENNRVLGYIGTVVRQVLCGGQSVAVAGIQNLVIHPDKRGMGFGRLILTKAREEAVKRGLRYGMLFCEPELEKFYNALGWHVIEGPVKMKDDRGDLIPITSGTVAMVKVFRGEKFPVAEIFLNGPDW